MHDQVPSAMQVPSSSPSADHSSADMYYTNVLFGHPLFAPSALVRRNAESNSQTQQLVVPSDALRAFNEDFIELDVHSDSAHTSSDGDLNDHNLVDSPPASSPSAFQNNSAVPPPTTPMSVINPRQSTDTTNDLISSSLPLQAEINLLESNCMENPLDGMYQAPSFSSIEESLPREPEKNGSNSSLPTCSVFQSSYLTATVDNSSGYDVFLMREHDIAPGNSMTSTVVNLLRGCNLLDSHTLEDLCNYLPILRRKYPPLTSNLLTIPASQPPANTCTVNARRDQVQQTSSSLLSRPPCPASETVAPLTPVAPCGGRLVDYLLTCSRLGSTALADFLPLEDDIFSTGHTHLLPLDWRRGRSDGLVCLAGVSRSVGLRVVGRFVTDWQSCASPGLRTHTDSLGRWLAEWIRAGAVVFFAQLDSPQRDPHSSSMRCQGTSNSSGGCCELAWRHRLIYGVTGYSYVHLSNPIETVHVRSLKIALNVETSICVPKADLLKLWTSDGALSQESCSSHSFLADQDLSLLAQHEDPRWRHFNILGQVISTLRDRDCYIERHTQNQKSALDGVTDGSGNGIASSRTDLFQENLRSEPHLIVPCAQRPGFSLFIPRNATLDDPRIHSLTPQLLYTLS
ncbi:hypothetical protein ECG_05564 [Echinococcus granulosus]|uniref:YTH domain-containing protein n=1 Tax=Echinococcus granulosus TaxID=6210 RepID=A0A068WEF2_ECHGR|nr:hypothetical protein ECG_05564 [Echinococcus granulosus]CDS18468.1 hypothetical protein EgrG_000625600 [Echinococcus granulosus]